MLCGNSGKDSMNTSVFAPETGVCLLSRSEQSSINSPLRQHILDTRPARLGRNAQEYTEKHLWCFTQVFLRVLRTTAAY